MYSNSILQLIEKNLPLLEKISEAFFQDPQDLTGLVLNVKENVVNFGLAILADNLNQMDQAIRRSHNRKKHWNIVKQDDASLLTSLGTMHYRKTLFVNKETGERCYLLDKLLGIASHERMTEDALAQIYEEAADSSYRKGGLSVSLTDCVSKQTVKNKIHELRFPEAESPEKRKYVQELYIDADEDHVALQRPKGKGGAAGDEKGSRKSGCISKLVYVYEGKRGEGRRKELIGTHYFSGVYEGREGNRRLWEEVNAYIQKNYEVAEEGHIFVNSDGGAWINRCEEVLGSKAVMVLDAFHLQEYIHKAARHMGDSQEDMKEELRRAVMDCRRVRVEELFAILEDFAQTEKAKETVKTCRTYLLGNWKRIKAAQTYREALLGCSAEGHVSHLLSSRLSSRPMGWSKTGVDRISHLRSYKANGGDMLELAKYQRVAVEAERKIGKGPYSAADIIGTEKRAKTQIEKYYDVFTKSLASSQARKMASIHFHVAGL